MSRTLPQTIGDKRDPYVAESVVQRLLVLGGLLVAFALRLFHLGNESLWYDETVSVVLARKSIPALVAHTAGDIHPPGYYLLLNYWQTLTQPSLFHGLEFLFAWPSLLFGVLIVAILFPLAVRLCDRRVAVLAVWLAAINPFHIWYSQEVRMYTVGAALGLLCFWLLLKYWQPDGFAGGKRPSNAFLLTSYAVCAALGLYVLYYFVFLLATLFLVALLLYRKKHYTEIHGGGTELHRESHEAQDVRAPSLAAWLIAYGAIALLWLPWLPTFWRQATNPPVPPWRVPWQSPLALLQTLAESLQALLLGQSMDTNTGIWALLALFLIAAHGGYTKSKHEQKNGSAGSALLLYIFAPLMMIVLTTVFVTPLYHVRYLFTYAPPFMIVAAAGIFHLYSIRRSIGAGLLLILLTCNILSLQRFWTDPTYRTDDHRAAVTELAHNWRPGDAILVNAGWAYTALEVYWPAVLRTPNGALPPELTTIQRITAVESELDAEQTIPPFGVDALPILTRTGSVDGAESLGWGSPNSDFFPLSRDATTAALDTLSSSHQRIWHYRLYDTVSDPDGVIRTWLDENANLAFDTPYVGRDFLRVQRYNLESSPARPNPNPENDIAFDDFLRLEGAEFAEVADAGELLYTTLVWRGLPALIDQPDDFNVSLRLYDSAGGLIVQSDEPLSPPTSEWDLQGQAVQPMALAVPAYSRPGIYSLEMVVYNRGTQEVLAPESDRTADGQRLQLGFVEIQPSELPLTKVSALATFDYIDLLESSVHPTNVAAGDALTVELVWLPRPNPYRDTYDVVLELRDGGGAIMSTWREPLGGASYPSGEWVFERPVYDRKIDPALPAGSYDLTLRVERSSDGLPIEAKTGWGFWGHDFIELGGVEVE